MKLYAVINGNSSSGFPLQDDFGKHGGHYHSGGIVILAASLDEAQALLKKEHPDYPGTLTEVPLDEPGVVLFADGDC